MDKRMPGIFFFLLLIILTGCQEETAKVTPEETKADEQQPAETRVAEYISLWNEAKFAEMYGGYLNDGTKEVYGHENFVAWQEQLYDELQISNVEVSYAQPEEGTEWSEQEPADFQIHVKMDTVAGLLEFDKTLTLLYEMHEEMEDWFVEWDPTYIFPKLEAGDVVEVATSETTRGELLDRNEKPIAVNSAGVEIGVVPANFDTHEQKEKLARALDITIEDIEEEMNQSWVQEGFYVPIAQVPATEEEILEQVFSIPGTQQKDTEYREYPYGAALSHLTGYIGPITAEQLEEQKEEVYSPADLIGRQGLERTLEDRLRGEKGVQIIAHKAMEGVGPVVLVGKEAVQGEIIKLTIDAELQKSIYNAMDGEPGTSAAVDPDTGETLALVSSPGYNPNEFLAGITGSRYDELSGEKGNPLFNRFAAAYAPGSAIKPVTAAIGLEANLLDPEEGIEIDGKTWQKNRSWGGFRITRLHEDVENPIDLNKALVYSDNIYFAQKGLEMGSETLTEGMKNFGFGESIPFPLNLQSSQVSNDGALASDGQTADTSYGQGQMLTNILHLASMYEPLINGGTMYEPNLFMTDDEPVVWKENLISGANAEILRESMRNAVMDGYAQSANIEEVAIAGKTGTAELKMRAGEDGKENGYFVAYDSENPKTIIAMMIEGIEDENGSDYVAGKVAEVFKKYGK